MSLSNLLLNHPGDIGAILPYAHGDATSLCGDTASGSCNQWFSRLEYAKPSTAARVARGTDFHALVERHFYAAVPEKRKSFEHIPESIARGVDAVLPARTAVFMDPARSRAIVPVGIDMSMGQAFDDPLGPDPASVVKRMAEAIGRDAGAGK